MKKQVFKDTAILIAGHALILGHKPESLSLEQVSHKLHEDPQDIASLGLFDSSSPNYTTYYPEVTAEDLNPKDSEFIEPVFRMLSNVTVHAQHNPIHFPVDVLRRSMSKLVGQTVNIDHEMAIGNAIGSVKAVEWQDEYKTKEGIKVPAGINATLKIDGKANPRIARGIMMDPPSIHANSVTVNFEWVKSHTDMDNEEFMSKLGTFDKSGKLIQRVVTDIIAYHETSLVGHGADPFAQKVGKDGKIVNPKYAKSRYALSDQILVHKWDWKDVTSNSESILTISNQTTIPDELNNINNNEQVKFENMELLRLLEKLFQLEDNSLTEENVGEKLMGIKTQFDGFKLKAEQEPEPIKIGTFEGLEAISTEITRLQEVEKSIPEKLEEKIKLAEIANGVISELRAETNRLYKLSVEEGKEDPNLLALINGANYDTLKSLHKQYDELTEEKFGFTCSKCGSHEVTRASAKTGDEDDDNKSKLSTAEVIDEFTSVRDVKLSSSLKAENKN